MAASWSRSRTPSARQKGFSWRIDNRGNIFIKRKFRNTRFPKIDKISCHHLDRLCGFMQDREWKALANNASKLCLGTEKEGIGEFLYKLRPEVSYAQLSSQLRAIFYQAGAWGWNEERRGMEFLLLSENWQEKTIEYYRNSLNSGSEAAFFDNVMEFEEKEKRIKDKSSKINKSRKDKLKPSEKLSR